MEKESIIRGASFIVSDFENQYLEIRKREQQHYTNDQIALLPDISAAHPHYREWQLRKNSCNRLINYLKQMKNPLNILEVGCGNGWLSAKMAAIENTAVTAADINTAELKQGASVFKNIENLRFVNGDIRDGIVSNQQFDAVVFAASVQYFPSLAQILQAALKLLAPGGEIHILDSPLYKDGDSAGAKQRAKAYFETLGFPGMAAFYFHHPLSELASFKYKVRYNPFAITNKLLRRRDPFYWITITL